MNQLATIEKSGRLVIPVQYRRALGLEEGEGVMISLKDGHIEISPAGASIRKAQERVKKYLKPGDNLVEMLLKDRREEAGNEK
ncbi:MAG: AbrB/MazE/SpoVT family DNA-binding domain-containing protein [Methylococcales bacterium]